MQKHLELFDNVAYLLRHTDYDQTKAELELLDWSFYDIEFRDGQLIAASYNGTRFRVEKSNDQG